MTLALIADTQSFRYRLKRGPCLWEMIYTQTGPIDFVAVGGSRMLAAFHPTQFEDAYRTLFDRNIVAYNFSRSWYGPDYSYAVLRDLFARRRVRHLLVMAEKQRNSVYNPVWYSVAHTSDLLMALTARPHAWVENMGSIALKFLQRLRDVVLLDAGFDTGTYERSASGILNTCYETDYELRPKQISAARKKLDRNGFTEVDLDITGPDQEYQLFFYRKIVQLAHRHGATVTFVYVPRLAGPDIGDVAKQRFESAVGAPLLRPPRELRLELNTSGYRDRTHMRASGREIFLPWLASTLAQQGKL